MIRSYKIQSYLLRKRDRAMIFCVFSAATLAMDPRQAAASLQLSLQLKFYGQCHLCDQFQLLGPTVSAGVPEVNSGFFWLDPEKKAGWMPDFFWDGFLSRFSCFTWSQMHGWRMINNLGTLPVFQTSPCSHGSFSNGGGFHYVPSRIAIIEYYRL